MLGKGGANCKALSGPYFIPLCLNRKSPLERALLTLVERERFLLTTIAKTVSYLFGGTPKPKSERVAPLLCVVRDILTTLQEYDVDHPYQKAKKHAVSNVLLLQWITAV